LRIGDSPAPGRPSCALPPRTRYVDCAKQTHFGWSATECPAFHYSIIAPFQSDGELCKMNPISGSRTDARRPNCAKQSQTWVGWGIWGPERGTRARCAKQTQFPVRPVGTGPRARGAIVQNKANLRPRARKWARGRDRQVPPGSHCAKQTQLPEAGHRGGVPAGPVGRGLGKAARGCRTNKPNFWHYADPEIGVPERANRAEQSQFFDCGARISGTAPGNRRPPSAALSDCGLGDQLPAGLRIVQNKPNFAGRRRFRRAKCAKRSQFRRGRVGRGLGDEIRWTRNPPPYADPTPRVRPQDNPVAWVAVVE
jgi:hypothetical protein